MKLSEWARRNGVHYQTAWQWARDGKMPVPVVKTATGRYLVLEQHTTTAEGRTVAYCRVSSADQKTDLERQAGRVVAAATGMGLAIADVVSEVGSGLNSRRPKLARLLRDPQVTTIVVEHRDRLTRFGIEHLTAALEATGRRIVVIDDTEVDDDLVRDMTEILTSFCARLYGRRSASRRAKAALRAAGETA
ncbi:IS607 family transposase [Planomonospora sp. ID82291]|uniref:IS607 family transposase n=1 Tax=Planomonospora sp. ID82291 TaxID=2738136 RepID=UPI0018C3CDD4|nr:IS607 family transposase [Planomonospora sp. ID82291]MBG0816037.1 IS607 family transposase [Planomonospora sp. ID82291]MBG0816203.1 IS607 family transposase [Planomonospora sp. ID82291]MBG0816270.1 IS607 family transposase [Planomonospora sp. ID82291]